MKKALAFLLALAMVFSLCACGGDSTGNSNPPADNSNPPANNNEESNEEGGSIINFDEDPYEVSIQFVGLFEANKNIANVEAALNEITKAKINCTVDIVPLFIGDLATTTSLGVAGNEKMDIVVAGLTSDLISMVSDELLLPLDDLLAERGQAALEVTKNVAEAQRIDGQTYAISGYPFAARAGGFVYNKTMADEYNIDMHDGMTMAELTEAAAILKEHGVYLTCFGNSSNLNFKTTGGGEYCGEYYGTNGEYGAIIDPVHSTTLENVYKSQELRDYFKTIKEWNTAGYLPAGQLTDTTTVQEYFAQQMIFGTGTDYTVNQLASWQFPSFETGIVRMNKPVIVTAGAVEFMLGIAANCERPDKAMDLINLIYSDPDVANLLQYGIEGTDYVAVEGQENVITYEGTPNEDHNSYYASFVHYGSPLELKIVSPLTDSYYDDVQAFEEEAPKSLAFGYTFDSSNFGAETGAISSVLQEKMPMLNAGEVADVDAAMDDLIAALETAGISDIIAANQEQLNAYLGQ